MMTQHRRHDHAPQPMVMGGHHPFGAFSFLLLLLVGGTQGFLHGVARRRDEWIKKQTFCRAGASDTANGNDYEVNGGYEWQAGNVYGDLDRLRRTIAIHNADEHLRQVRVRQELDHFAASRRPLLKDVLRWVALPTTVALFLSRIPMKHQTNNLVGVVTRGFAACYNLQFWWALVVSPIMLLAAKRRALPPPEPIPDEFAPYVNNVFFDEIQQLIDWEDTRTSCKDSVLVLLEYWVSSVIGALLLQSYLLLPHVPKPSMESLIGTRFLTRLGVVAAVHQYPKTLFELQRQCHPLDRFSTRLQGLTNSLLATTPFLMSYDLSLAIRHLPKAFVGFGLLMALLSVTHQICDNPDFPGRRRGAILLLAQGLLLIGSVRRLIFTKPTLGSILRHIPVGLALLGPLAHIAAFRKMLRVCYTHDLSLGNEASTTRAILANRAEMKRRTKWRYRLESRDPERFSVSFSNLCYSFASNFLSPSQSYSAKLDEQDREEESLYAFRETMEKIKEMDESYPFPILPSSEWKRAAMEAIAKHHQEDYESGDFKDPLGVAIQQTFGIGLAYDFDHMRPLDEGEKPTSRRLQARAAKSAVRRAQAIYESATEENQRINSIVDTDERERMRSRNEYRMEKELEYIRKQLTDLIPNDNSEPIDFTIFTPRKRIRRVAKNHYVIETEKGPGEEESGQLVARLRPAGKSTARMYKRREEQQPFGDSFVDAWKKSQAGSDDQALA